MIAPDRNLFRYRLLGYDKAWSKPAKARNATFTNLKPGSYQFQVIAANNHGVWNEKGAVLAFAIAPFFYQTKAFYFLIAGVLVGIAALIQAWRLRLARRIHSFEKLQALNDERTRIAW